MNQLILATVWLIPAYGLLGALVTLPWSLGLIQRTGSRPAAYLNILASVVAFLHGAWALVVGGGLAPQELTFHWLQVADLDLTLAVRLSPQSLLALTTVTTLTLIAQIFALGYMEKDWSLARFYGLMGFFEAALGGIALSDSLILSYMLLELLTLSTYLLVGFWYAQPLVVTAARDAFLTKRIGDVLFLMGVVALSSLGAGLTFTEISHWAATATLSPTVWALLGLALIAGPTGKCAQFPLHLWLDEAMEGPNPASILRNSIVVSAGAYVLDQLEPVLARSPVALDTLVILGTITAVGASLMAMAQIDMKRTLSHSTSAYLGLVFICVGLKQQEIAFLLLFAHGVAKALLFMSTGGIILTTSSQDITEMGGIWRRLPVTTTSFVVGALGLMGLFPLGIFWVFCRWFATVPGWILGLILLVNFLSALNLTRVFRLVFLGTTQPKTRRTPEVAWPMAVPMVAMIVITLLTPFFLNAGQITLGWEQSGKVLLLVITGILGCITGASLGLQRQWLRSTQTFWRFSQDFLAYDFYMERVYQATVVQWVRQISRLTAWLDRYVVDGLVNLVGVSTIFSGQLLRYSANGKSQVYLLTILIGVLVVFGFFLNGGK
ncbi:NAD(P)H dehydrogenase subunit NdhF3 family protein [Gloeomargarita lithophora Alchichica-D10]|uniref:NAD(P)H dehydrogenase subunit NdhF3 family protein n=1 Tax=Gloeomargarita lithophora Alchichica-D10 TaxID=1188229 RepID=A0A1J0ABC3_9CYAN|nr:NAD(P)H-quinone oxidoreductase subunit F [Gloeomargarita lithophora]APB33230.1 NAD(P)H dehydrogenase subunit NdhF3 family protein [Gloeomargarita lithophora Alchichica-D10]